VDRRDQALSRLSLLGSLSLLAIGWCAVSLAASNSIAPCDAVGKDLRSLEIPVNELNADTVDHMPASGGMDDTLDARSVDSANAAPRLFLTPRVASILREVFGADSDSDVAMDITDDVDTEDRAPSQETLAPVTLIDEAAETPRFQRQMFRKDI